jgi:glycosyltransferase involved in cell wall biosynthesis
MWRGKVVSLALPTRTERDSIYNCIQQFLLTGIIDEIVVCNNNAEHGTSQEIHKTRAIEVLESRQGYGWAIRSALAATTGDLIVVAEPDGTFAVSDVFRLLDLVDSADLVVGSRTHTPLIEHGANMGPFRRCGNRFVAGVANIIFRTIKLTDVGCTIRVVTRGLLNQITPHFTAGDSSFGLEMILLGASCGAKVTEVPVTYKPRIGTSTITGSRLRALGVGLRMTFLILRYGLALQKARADGRSRS